MITHLELLNSGSIIVLAVEIVGVESLDSLQHLMVLLAHEFAVSSLVVPGVEGVVSDHGKTLVRESGLLLDDVVEVLIVSPAEHDIVHANTGLVDTELGAVYGVVIVRVALEGVGVDDAMIEGQANRKGIANDIPLALGIVEVEELAKVVDETSQLHPARTAISSHSLSSLEQVLDLAELGIGVTLINEGVELLNGLPDGHLLSLAGSRVESQASLEVVGHGLLLMLLLVEGLDSVAGLIVLSELGLVLVGVELGISVEVVGGTVRKSFLELLGGVDLENVHGVNGIGGFLESLAVLVSRLDLVGLVLELRGSGRGSHCG